VKALVLARGLGKRMRQAAGVPLDSAQQAAANAGLKALMPVGGRPFLDYVLHSLAEAGVDEAGLVVGPEHDQIRDYYRALPMTRLRVSFITQREALGTADAVLAAESWVEGGQCLALNSDNLYPIDVLRALVEARGPAVPGFERDSLGLPIERIGAFALIESASPRGRRHPCLSRIFEKPGVEAMERAGPHALVSMNVWRFDSRIFEACRDVPVSERGEKELPHAVGLAASRGVCFEVMPVRGRVLDLSRRDDVAAVGRELAHHQVRL